MEELPSMNKTEQAIHYQITKHREFIQQEDKWHRQIDKDRGL
jgi:hypothetical protein